MNDLFSTITGIAMHAYYVAAFITIITIPARMLFRALNKKAPL